MKGRLGRAGGLARPVLCIHVALALIDTSCRPAATEDAQEDAITLPARRVESDASSSSCDEADGCAKRDGGTTTPSTNTDGGAPSAVAPPECRMTIVPTSAEAVGDWSLTVSSRNATSCVLFLDSDYVKHDTPWHKNWPYPVPCDYSFTQSIAGSILHPGTNELTLKAEGPGGARTCSGAFTVF